MSDLPSGLQHTGLQTLDATADARIRHDEIVNAALLQMYGSMDDAKMMAKIPGIGFGTSDGHGHYNYQTTGSNPSAATIDKTITPESIKQVSITVDGHTEYFKRIANIDGDHDTASGLKASAWVATTHDGKPLTDASGHQQVRLEFAGLSGDKKDSMALMSDINGALDPQITEAARFTGDAIKTAGGKDHISTITIGSHSMGGFGALAAHAVSDLSGIKTQSTMIIEPVAATQARDNMRQAMNDPNSELSKTLRTAAGLPDTQATAAHLKSTAAALDSDTVSIRGIHEEAGMWLGTRVSNLVPHMGAVPLADGVTEEVRRDTAIELAEKFPALRNPILQKMQGTLSHIPSNREDPLNGTIGRTVYEVEDLNLNAAAGSLANSSMDKLDRTHRIANLDDNAIKGAAFVEIQNTLKASGVTQAASGASNAATPSHGKSVTGPSHT